MFQCLIRSSGSVIDKTPPDKVCPSCRRLRPAVLFRGAVCEACRPEPARDTRQIVKRNKKAARVRRVHARVVENAKTS